ncbi:MAG: phosphotransferase [Pseudomonadota bacterium]
MPDNPVINELSVVRRSWTPEETIAHIRDLPIWTGNISVEQKFGGLQNRTFFVTDGDGRRSVVRVGFDQYRTRQTAVVECVRAAHRLGLGPALLYAEPNLSITAFQQGTGMTLEQMGDPAIIRAIIDRMKVLHEGSHAVHETISYWWPFDTIRRYLNICETGKPSTGNIPSAWADRIPRYRRIVDELEAAIGPFHPKFTHNDMVFANMIFRPDGELVFIDWDGGAYGHPLWDLAEMLMWAEADEGIARMALAHYYPGMSAGEEERRLKEVYAFQAAAGLRLVTETMENELDPYYFLTPAEIGESMKLTLPGEKPELAGLIDLIDPRFEELWKQYRERYSR